MKTTFITFFFVALLAGCNSSQPTSPEKHQGRQETQKLEGASAVGYDGTAIRKNVDSTLNRNDDHNKKLDNAVNSGEDSQQKN